jgi:NOL1/NOP2/fmu family ribosome biogenesis protein
MSDGHDGQRFDRLPATAEERTHEWRPTRAEIVDWWDDRFGVPPETFDDVTFWEKGKGQIWAFRSAPESPVRVESLGTKVVRTRQEHWKPTTEAVQRFGDAASGCVIHLSEGEATAFLAGHDQELDWDGDWGYLIATHDLVDDPEPIGVGLYLHGELRSQIPKGRQREF